MSRNIVVFGAETSVGALVARQYGNEGYDVVLVAQQPHALRALTTILRSEGVSTRTFTGDLSRPEHATAIIKSIRSKVGPIDAVFYGPTQTQADDALPQDTPDRFDPSMTAIVNEVLPEMRSRKAGAILVAPSCMAIREKPSPSADSTKSAASVHMQRLQRELAKEGVHLGTLRIGSLSCQESFAC